MQSKVYHQFAPNLQQARTSLKIRSRPPKIKMDHQQNSSNNLDKALSEDTQDTFQSAELMELMFEETMLTQHHKLFDIIEQLDHIQWSNYTYGEGFKKLTSIVKQLDKIRTNSLDLPEFIKRLCLHPQDSERLENC